MNIHSMKAIITGGTGFLGKYMIKEMEEKYEQIIVLARDPTKVKTTEKIIPRKGDITDLTSLKSVFEGVDHVYHMAAKVGSWPKDPTKGYIQTNIEGTRNVIEQAMKEEVSKIIYTSSYFALGETGEEIVDEKWDTPPNFKHPYVNTKYQSGKLVDELIKENGIPIVSVVPTTIVGVGMDNPLSAVITEFLEGKLPGLPKGGKTRLNYVLVEDVAKGHLLAAEKGKVGEKYILGGENMALKDFLLLYGEVLKLKKPRSLPNFAVWFYARIQEFKREPEMTRGDFNVAKRNFTYTSEKAQKELGYSKKAIQTIVNPMLEYFIEADKLNLKTKEKVAQALEKNE